jgi:hypothetical protein
MMTLIILRKIIILGKIRLIIIIFIKVEKRVSESGIKKVCFIKFVAILI